jgi:hypothetical protein
MLDVENLGVGDETLLDILTHCSPENVECLGSVQAAMDVIRTHRLSTPLSQGLAVGTQIGIHNLWYDVLP